MNNVYNFTMIMCTFAINLMFALWIFACIFIMFEFIQKRILEYIRQFNVLAIMPHISLYVDNLTSGERIMTMKLLKADYELFIYWLKDAKNDGIVDLKSYMKDMMDKNSWCWDSRKQQLFLDHFDKINEKH